MKLKKHSADAEELSDLRFIQLDALADHDKIENRDIDKEHVDFLRESIEKSGGLDVPLIAWDGGNPTNMMKVMIDGSKQQLPATFLIAGFHRREALKKIRKDDSAKFKKLFPEGIPVKVAHGSLEDALLTQLRENVARVNPTAAEVLPFIKRLIDGGMKRSAIAKRIGKSPAYISQVMSIEEELGDEASEDLKKGDIDLAEGVKAANKVKKGKLSKSEAREEAKRKTKAKKDKGHSRADKRHSLKKLKAAYDALPNLGMGKRIQVLEGIIEYAIGESDDLPDQLEIEDEEKKSKKKKKSKE
jgi:hypothetical protein